MENLNISNVFLVCDGFIFSLNLSILCWLRNIECLIYKLVCS